MRKLFALMLTTLFVFTTTLAFGFGGPPAPPSQPTSGYGSAANYICNTLYTGAAINHNNAIDFGDSDSEDGEFVGDRWTVETPRKATGTTDVEAQLLLAYLEFAEGNHSSATQSLDVAHEQLEEIDASTEAKHLAKELTRLLKLPR